MGTNICKKCLIYDSAEEDQKMIEKYMNALKTEDQVSDDIYEERIKMCKSCDFLNVATCNACGCYVELRAAAINGRCPHKKWKD